ncbi:nucleoside-diphosphate kinase [Desulfolithobacter dissulfuricans]|uniref:Nucleoside diphosphate kinase n=1 Tax=Desulfolithobacter dissulfuricans TaxID=2795293 RepID=A0A915U2P8_9BACT|nr:nucleoside-diphosphate kinase [Desulfolithobacter dissulfuricans]BCO09422.1 nucleoside-diphosphate kinase [Desulfolithobacter dissulfuricans]
MERTFVMIKPDAVQRGLIGEIIHRFERRGLKIVAMKFMHVSEELAAKHYAAHKEKPFYRDLIDYITSGPVVAMVLEGTGAIATARTTMGATNPAQAAPGTIRADFSLEIGRNIVHGSDGEESAAAEIGLWFGDDIPGWERNTDKWIFE